MAQNNKRLQEELRDVETRLVGIRNMMKYEAKYIAAYDRILGVMQKVGSIRKALLDEEEGNHEEDSN